MISPSSLKSVFSAPLPATVALVALGLVAWRDSWPSVVVCLGALVALEVRAALKHQRDRKVDEIAGEIQSIKDQLARAKNRGAV